YDDRFKLRVERFDWFGLCWSRFAGKEADLLRLWGQRRLEPLIELFQPLCEGAELKLVENFLHRKGIKAAWLGLIEVKRDRQVGADARQILAEVSGLFAGT